MKISITINDIDPEEDKAVLADLLAVFGGFYADEDSEDDEEEEAAAEEEEEDEEEPKEAIPEEPLEGSETPSFIANYRKKPAPGGRPYCLRLHAHAPISVSSWKEVLVTTAETMIKDSRLALMTLPYKNSKIPLVSTVRTSTRPHVQLSNGLFIDAGHNARDVMNRACELFRLCHGTRKGIEVDYVMPSLD
jgi:hypothetical protein